MPEKKKFFEIEIPLLNRKISLLAYNKEKLADKTVKLDLTRELRGKSLEAIFTVKLEKENLTIIPKKLWLLKFYIRRMIRKSTSYIEDSFSADCKNAKLRIKPFLIARKKVSRAVRKSLRNQAKTEIKEYIKDKNYEDVFKDIIENKMQRPLSLKLKKIYPLALCEIREINLEKLQEVKEKQEEKKIKVKVEKIEIKGK